MNEELKDTLIQILKLTDKQRKKLIELIDEEQAIFYECTAGGCDALWIETDLTENEQENLSSINFGEEDWLEAANSYVKMYI